MNLFGSSVYANVKEGLFLLHGHGSYFSGYTVYAHLPAIMNMWIWSKLIGV